MSQLPSLVNDEDFEDVPDMDNDKDELMDDGLGLPPVHLSLSLPSGLPIPTIAGLSHNELKHNPEFNKYVNMVSQLQELLTLRSSFSTCTFMFFLTLFSAHNHPFFSLYCCHLFFVLASERLCVAGYSWPGETVAPPPSAPTHRPPPVL